MTLVQIFEKLAERYPQRFNLVKDNVYKQTSVLILDRNWVATLNWATNKRDFTQDNVDHILSTIGYEYTIARQNDSFWEFYANPIGQYSDITLEGYAKKLNGRNFRTKHDAAEAAIIAAGTKILGI